MTNAEQTTTKVEVRLREQTPPTVTETVEQTLAQLRMLERNGVVSELHVDSWGPSCGRGAGDPASRESTFEEYQTWARRNGCSLRPAFDRREVSAMFCTESHVRHVVPIMAVAVYQDGELQCVTPCSDGECTYTVRDCIDALEADADDPLDHLNTTDASSANGPIASTGPL